MSVPGAIFPHETPGSSLRARLVGAGLEELRQLAHRRAELRKALTDLEDLGGRSMARSTDRLMRQIDLSEPNVTLIGQVKAGKTTLLNALIGWPGLLPADVNPWTSVVTSLHLGPPGPDRRAGARFRFFDEGEWQRLIESGGRLGELAARAGADDDLARVRDQITRMRERSRKRLGRRFELLMGQEHDYDHLDAALIERYVCLGDDPDLGAVADDRQGRFADITRSADITLPTPGIPVALCLRDTPGVNDTFMMREQITIAAIRDSRLCVVVFSAPQAMTAMDLALVRMIANVRARDVIIFVNRIDELADPGKEVPLILARIRETLADHEGPAEAEVIFGSALWAEACLGGGFERLPPDSAAALLNWADARLHDKDDAPAASETVDLVWELSGIAALGRGLARRIRAGQAEEALQKVARGALNLLTGLGIEASGPNAAVARRRSDAPPPAEIARQCDEVSRTALAAFDSESEAALHRFTERIGRAHRHFLDRATASLVTHLEAYGERSPWTYGADGLRVLLRSNYLKCGADLQRALLAAQTSAAEGMGRILGRLVDLGTDKAAIHYPDPPPVPPPVTLAQTIALDLQAGWWRSLWFRARGYGAFAEKFEALIAAETMRMLDSLQKEQLPEFNAALRAQLEGVLREQRETIVSLAQAPPAAGSEVLREATGLAAATRRREERDRLVTEFERFAG